jgi:hypothetical protein
MSSTARWIRTFAAFWWDFVVGDDWRIAAGVVVAVAGTAALAAANLPAWWLLPVCLPVLLGGSLLLATRRD